ncbi:hypothetical protein C9426_25555 [Serratia sp. S1B]|nr:hypothetical protein C9426_25555 [Serratia sp. S1B]
MIRSGWFTNSTKERYEVSQKGEIFRGSQVSKLSLVQFIAQIINHPELYIKESIGIYDR